MTQLIQALEDNKRMTLQRMLGKTWRSDKKKAGKFQPFKKLFGKRKKREPVSDCEEAKLKPSHSFGNICNGTFSSDEEPNTGLRSSHYSMGSRAFSHDSIFIPDGRTESEEAIQAMSQENVIGKVKTLQQQLAKNIKFGQPPQMTVSGRMMGEANASVEEDAFLGSLMEIDSQQDTVLPESGNKSADAPDLLRTMNLPGIGQVEEKVPLVKSSRPKRQFSCSGTIETINLDAVPQAVARLDNSAAKHKLSVKPKKQRMSRKHKRLTKGSQSLTITEFEPEDLETELFVDRYPGFNGHIMADKLIQNRDEPRQLQLAEEKRIEDHWGILEAEKIRQIVEMEEQRELEEQRCQELEEQMQKEQERKDSEKESSQYLLEGEIPLKIEVQSCQEEERRLLKAEKRQELEDQTYQELEEQRQKELEEQQRRELEEQKCKEQDEQLNQELEEQKHQEWEKQQRQEMEEQKHWTWDKQQRQEMEEQKCQEHRQELEKQKHWEQEEQQRQELEEQKCWEQEQQKQKLEEQKTQELEEQKHQELEEQRHKELEEQQRKELEKQKRLELEELKQRETEKWCQEEKETNQLEEQKELVEQNKEEKQRRLLEEKEAEIKLKQEKEAESSNQQKKEEEERQHLKEREKTEEEQPQQLLEKKQKREEPRKHKLTKQMHLESTDIVQQDELKQQKEQEWNKLEEQKIDTEGQNLHQQEKSLEQDKNQMCSGGADRNPADDKLQERSRHQKVKQPEKGNKTAEEILAQKLKREVDAQEQKRIGEELRWQEVDERQTASRSFTFQVSSGDKQIIFQKVNLSPVMPAKGAGLSSPSVKDSRMHGSSKGSHTLPSSVCVPHTAILVTGAQLCGTAVNLNQIKDTACKSLLGLTEEKKNVDIPSPEKAQKKSPGPKPSNSKMKYAQETLDQATLAEWASIRSRILKNKENGKYNEKDRVSVCRHSDDWTPRGRGSPHGNLRKTLSANAKFSITPAWQKFSEASKTNSGAENISAVRGHEKVAVGRNTGSSTESNEDVVSTFKDNLSEVAKEKTETHGEIADNTEGCKFAKDLPSFLVPSLPHSPGKELPHSELAGAPENQQNNSTKKPDKPAPNGEENVSPFGIKLRRTNYSLRFHYDQQAEQRKKKRYSAGDSFDGVPDPLLTTEGEKESAVFAQQESTSPGTGKRNVHGNLKDSKDSSVTVLEISQPAGTPLPATSQGALPPHEKPACKSLVPQKPALAPKPASQTPPSSPLSKMNRSNLADTPGRKFVKAESEGSWRKDDRAVPPVALNDSKNEEEEIREKKSFFPSLSIPWREKNDKKPEPLKKEKPVLQSRHSLDGSKLMEKVETSQPLWITLALQKQKGFREQQATREERRQAREAKQAEKLAKENAALSNQSDNKSSSSKTSTLQKSTPQEGEKKIETAVSRLERREQLKKSNTLPTSVTVEISDSVPPTPLTKEVAKRFSTPDANPVSTEPAWLALAKRKAKAWSDCPQIIK
ncbi:hypothetical protein ASZ78_015067 [Callipepla squamata]|uniref:DUF4592 domain-containing protein n=1 Tax=Callipepla squamata TaxID=9009 RepID=A0A226MID3_CALSU|nr:hypothetical protein ASZ78_015067 [Callipepla squamata]